jgi:hypothetical protein
VTLVEAYFHHRLQILSKNHLYLQYLFHNPLILAKMAPIATSTMTESATPALHLRGDHVGPHKTKTTHKENLDSNPFTRVWRGDRAGTIKMPGVPTFDDKYEERTWVKQHMAGCFRYWGKMGFGEGTAGHITVRDPVLTDHYWMNPFGMHFSLIKVSSPFV